MSQSKHKEGLIYSQIYDTFIWQMLLSKASCTCGSLQGKVGKVEVFEKTLHVQPDTCEKGSWYMKFMYSLPLHLSSQAQSHKLQPLKWLAGKQDKDSPSDIPS